jgi:DMSO/TMAO reductase YedYZ molybdopterin-dependent catalytic subunit
MDPKLRVMTERPLNAETPIERLRSWITGNEVFFKRNQGQFPDAPVNLSDWTLTIDGLIKSEQRLGFRDILRLPKVEAAATLECSGNGRSLLEEKASGNPWTIGGVGNAVWGGIWLGNLLEKAGLEKNARHVSFEGFDKPLGKSKTKFIRSIPIEKAIHSTLLAYEMNGEPLPLSHGFPLRAIALGWTGANCVKWLHKVTVLEAPFEGFFMDEVYRSFQKGENRKEGTVVTAISLKSIITEPLADDQLSKGIVPIRGAAYAGEHGIERVEVSVDGGKRWHAAELIGLQVPYAWRHWEYLWEAKKSGAYTIRARATDTSGRIQPETARWNVLGYGNNGVQEHTIAVRIN